jgi:hypothetical protein
MSDQLISTQNCHFNSATDLLQRMVWGIKWYIGECDYKPKLPITLNILTLLLLLHPAPVPFWEINYIVTLCLALSAFLHCGDFTVKSVKSFNEAAHLTWNSL